MLLRHGGCRTWGEGYEGEDVDVPAASFGTQGGGVKTILKDGDLTPYNCHKDGRTVIIHCLRQPIVGSGSVYLRIQTPEAQLQQLEAGKKAEEDRTGRM